MREFYWYDYFKWDSQWTIDFWVKTFLTFTHCNPRIHRITPSQFFVFKSLQLIVTSIKFLIFLIFVAGNTEFFLENLHPFFNIVHIRSTSNNDLSR